jgi:16S rRNA (guanine966-N2)-methyltransferase
LRIITGAYKGRRLFTPSNDKIRPTSDKVKESIFNMIAHYTEDVIIADLFCGSGNLGIEALSRGARKAYFIDKARESITLTKKNIEYCNASAQSVLLLSDAEKALDRIHEKVDIFFLDPPYKSGVLIPCIEKIARLDLLADNGIIVVEHGFDEPLPATIGSYMRLKDKRYGKIIIEVYAKDMGG